MVERRHRHVEYQCVESGSYWNIHWFVLVSSHEWLPELLCFPAYSRRICWAFQFRIDLSNACIYKSGFLKSYPTVKQLISKKSVADILGESLTQGGRAGLLECLTRLFQTPCWVTSGYEMKSPCLSPYLQSSVWATLIVWRSFLPRFIMNCQHVQLTGTLIVNNEGWKLRWARKCHADTIGRERHHILDRETRELLK